MGSTLDKGRLALGQLVQLGDIEDIGIIASSRLYSLLRMLSSSRGGNEGAERLFVAGRRTAQFSEFIEHLGREVALTLVRWLVSKGILLRGARIKCPRCQLEIWYEVDRIGKTWHCDGCQVSLPIPLDPIVTPWVYRINELYARGHDQGTITHLLALYNLFPPTLLGQVSNLGCYPGVVLKAKEGSGTPLDEVEIDIIGIRDGKLTLAECKGTGGTLTEEEAFELAKVANH